MHTIEKNGYYASVDQRVESNSPAYKSIDLFVKEQMEKIRIDMEKKFGVKVKVFITNGHVYSDIVDFAKKKNIDLIVMVTHGISGVKELFIGSNAHRVVSLSEIPVITVRTGKSITDIKNILLPIDDASHSREKVNVAMDIAKMYGAKIHLIGLPFSKKKDDVNEMEIKLKSVEKVIKEYKLPYITTIVHGKNLMESALKYGKSNKCDLIVINTGHESKTTGSFLGLLAQQIINHSTIPVLSVRATEDNYLITAPGYGIS